MARKKSAEPQPLPSKEDVLAFVRGQSGKVGKREIARAFGIHGRNDRSALKDLLGELADEGLLERRRKRLGEPGRLPPVGVIELVERGDDDRFLAIPNNWDADEAGPPPRIVLERPSRQTHGPAPDLRDRVLARLEAEQDSQGRVVYSARMIRIIGKAPKPTIGVFKADRRGGGKIQPIDKKDLQQDVRIPSGQVNGARDGDLVTVDVSRGADRHARSGRIMERLGSVSGEKAVSMIALHAHEIPHVFPDAVLAEARAARAASVRGREDWRTLPLVTIDPPDAKDHDDAVHAERDPDPGNPGGFLVTVAIADVAWYVRPGSAIDREARTRGNSVYFPDRVVPMLPERISNDLCSLRPDVDRPALALRMVFDSEGRKQRHTFHRVMMRSAARLAYAQAQDAIDGRPDDVTGPLLETVLRPLWDAYAALKRSRGVRAPLDLDLPERKLVLKDDGTVDRVIIPERLDAHRLIEEFMIQANVAAAETLEQRKTPLIYRVHDAPSASRIEALREFLRTVDIKLPKSGSLKPNHFNGILGQVRGSRVDPLVNEVVLRSQAQAEYNPENYGHFGLNLKRYAHFTSPIRRYADLIVHRALIRALDLGKGALEPDIELHDVAARISGAERRAMAAERETVDRLIAGFMSDRIGADFQARISGVTRAGLFVRLEETGADGFIPISTLGIDYYIYDEAAHSLIGEMSGETYRLGDVVEVKLVEAAPLAGALRFQMLSEGRRPARKSSGRKAPRGRRKER